MKQVHRERGSGNGMVGLVLLIKAMVMIMAGSS